MGGKKDPKDKKKKRAKHKDSQLLVRVTAAERDAFMAACEAADTSASREIRSFMQRYVEDREADAP